MSKVLITGMSGAGKSTLLAELAARGHRTVDTDYDGYTAADGRWDEERMYRLLNTDQPLIISGTVENQGKFRAYFDHVVLLSAPLDVLLQRVAQRTTSPYGTTERQRQEIRDYVHTVQPLLQKTATLELDGQSPLAELADEVETLLRGMPPGPMEPTDRPLQIDDGLRTALTNADLGLTRGTVQLAPYSSRWPIAFHQAAQVLHEHQPSGILAIEHFGSTAVPHLPAKPILDIALGVEDERRLKNLYPWLLSLGFIYRGQRDARRPNTIYGFELTHQVRLINLHVLAYGETRWDHYMNFRNHLRADEAAARDYARLKQHLASAHPGHRDAYLAGKENFILRHTS